MSAGGTHQLMSSRCSEQASQSTLLLSSTKNARDGRQLFTLCGEIGNTRWQRIKNRLWSGFVVSPSIYATAKHHAPRSRSTRATLRIHTHPRFCVTVNLI
jgi:hypothetical protein